jgi:hypothetical protein
MLYVGEGGWQNSSIWKVFGVVGILGSTTKFGPSNGSAPTASTFVWGGQVRMVFKLV